MVTKIPSWARLLKEAERFGVTEFRPGQKKVIASVFAGKDTLAIMPTGAGKSLTYQLPALFLPKLTVVVSPLISLMQDQQEKLAEADVDAAKLNSTLSTREEKETVAEIADGQSSIVYVTPERMENPDYVELLRARGVSLFVIDEAHCISQWGHDFRPSYLALRDAIARLEHPPVLAVTATATPDVAADIVKQLAIEGASVINTGTERNNLFFEVIRTVNGTEKRRQLLKLLRTEKGSGIVYVATVKTADELWEWLGASGVDAGRYHGKMRTKDREEEQDRFMGGKRKVIVATNAFGLGVDKPDIRFVVHYQFPDSLETYYQEAGRAGRDGLPARAVLLYQLEDRRIQAFFLGGKYPKRDDAWRLLTALQAMATKRPVGIKTLANSAGLGERRCKVLAALLEGAGVAERTPRGVKVLKPVADVRELEKILGEYESRHVSDRRRLQQMMHYAQSTACRTKMLIEYFGESYPEDCGHCDNCRARAAGKFAAAAPIERARDPAVARESEASRYAPGDHVGHARFGVGRVLEVHDGKATVEFPDERKTVLDAYLTPADSPPAARK